MSHLVYLWAEKKSKKSKLLVYKVAVAVPLPTPGEKRVGSVFRAHSPRRDIKLEEIVIYIYREGGKEFFF